MWSEEIAKKYNKKVIFLAGSILDNELDSLDIDSKKLIDCSFSILRGIISLDQAMNKEIATVNMNNAVSQVFNLLEIFKNE